jgi:hypothetical protein
MKGKAAEMGPEAIAAYARALAQGDKHAFRALLENQGAVVVESWKVWWPALGRWVSVDLETPWSGAARKLSPLECCDVVCRALYGDEDWEKQNSIANKAKRILKREVRGCEK